MAGGRCFPVRALLRRKSLRAIRARGVRRVSVLRARALRIRSIREIRHAQTSADRRRGIRRSSPEPQSRRPVLHPLLAAFIAFTAWTAKSWRVFREQAAAFAIGLGIAACVWLPSLAQTKYVGVDRLLEGYLRYTNHFVYPHQLLYSPWGYGLSVAGDQDGLSFAIGWSHLLLAAVVLAWIAWTRRFADARWLAFFAFSAVILSILMVQDAEWIWDQIKLLQYTEFPWRLLGPVSVCVALLIAPLGPLLASLKRWRVPAFAAALALLIVPNIAHLHPKQFHDVDPTLWTPAQIAWRGVDVATAGEYRPRWMQTLPPFTVEIAGAADAQIRQTRRTPVSWSGEIQAAYPTTVEMAIAYFPGWRARVDGREVESHPADNTGLIRFDVPAGAHHIDVAFTRTASVWAGDLISLLCVVLFGAAALSSLRHVEHGRSLDETLARGVELAPEQRDHREYVHPNQQREPSAHAPVEHVVVGHVPDVPSKRRRR